MAISIGSSKIDIQTHTSQTDGLFLLRRVDENSENSITELYCSAGITSNIDTVEFFDYKMFFLHS